MTNQPYPIIALELYPSVVKFIEFQPLGMELIRSRDQFEIWPPLIGIILFLLDKQMKPIVRKSMPKLVVQLRFRAVGEMADI